MTKAEVARRYIGRTVQNFEDGDTPAGGFTFSTAAVYTVIYDSEEQARFIRRVASSYRARVEAASSVLQVMENIPEDFRDDAYWPNYVDVI